MSAELRTTEDDLRDLAAGQPPLIEARDGLFTGVTLRRCLGVGGMSSVFLGELDGAQRSAALSPLAPRWLALKFTKLSTERQLARLGIDPRSVYTREVAALGRVMERRPPTPFVIGLYGSGSALVTVSGGESRPLPWLALEFIDGGPDGATLTERMRRATHLDPGRALRLANGLLEGVRVLHDEGVLHRDIKPDNVFLTGDGDTETPKLADCGIARVSGMSVGTLAAMTPSYGGPEQVLSAWRPTEHNPLVGPWTDVHALAATLWFVLAGEDWCRGETDLSWHAGERRSLRTARRSVGGIPGALLDRLDGALRRGASHRLPAVAWTPGSAGYERLARVRFAASMFAGPERHASVDELATELRPLLVELRDRWVPSPTPVPLAASPGAAAGEAHYREVASRLRFGEGRLTPATMALVQPDGRVLARFDDQLLYLVGDRPCRVAVPDLFRPVVAASRWLVRGPGGGFLLAGPAHLLHIRGGRFASLSLPAVIAEGPVAPSPVADPVAASSVGPIVAVACGALGLVVVSAATPDRGPLGWRLAADGWEPPVTLPLSGEVQAVSEGPDGWMVVGADAAGAGRGAWWSSTDGRTHQRPAASPGAPWRVVLAGPAGEAWVASGDRVLRLGDGSEPEVECSGVDGEPLALATDPLGLPWLLTACSVWRRQADGGWHCLYRRDPSRPALVALGFSVRGVRVVDSSGGSLDIEPRNLDGWRAAANTSLLLSSG